MLILLISVLTDNELKNTDMFGWCFCFVLSFLPSRHHLVYVSLGRCLALMHSACGFHGPFHCVTLYLWQLNEKFMRLSGGFVWARCLCMPGQIFQFRFFLLLFVTIHGCWSFLLTRQTIDENRNKILQHKERMPT